MSYLNKYKPPVSTRELFRDAHLDTPLEEYDLNWAHGDISILGCGKIQLRPFIVSGPSAKTLLILAFYPCQRVLEGSSGPSNPEAGYVQSERSRRCPTFPGSCREERSSEFKACLDKD
jgi:hypothetical protein